MFTLNSQRPTLRSSMGERRARTTFSGGSVTNRRTLELYLFRNSFESRIYYLGSVSSTAMYSMISQLYFCNKIIQRVENSSIN